MVVVVAPPPETFGPSVAATQLVPSCAAGELAARLLRHDRRCFTSASRSQDGRRAHTTRAVLEAPQPGAMTLVAAAAVLPWRGRCSGAVAMPSTGWALFLGAGA